MPRIRTIKPDVWDSPDFMQLDAGGQLAFFALISLADDEGRLRTDAHHLHLVALRSLEVAAVEHQLELMERLGMIAAYEIEGRSYIALLNWPKHQKVDHARPSEHPAPPASKPRPRSRRVASPREDSREIANAREESRGFDPSRAPADRIVDRKGEDQEEREPPLPPAAVDNPTVEDSGLDPRVRERLAFLEDGFVAFLGRAPSTLERGWIQTWAGWKRRGVYVPPDEVMLAARWLMGQKTAQGTLPSSLCYIAQPMTILLREEWVTPEPRPDRVVLPMPARRAEPPPRHDVRPDVLAKNREWMAQMHRPRVVEGSS